MGPLELIYHLGYSLKKSHNMKNRKRLPRRVISIGNLTLGGTGKTPAVIAVAEEAKRRGLSPCILTRGYKGKAKGPCVISKGEGALLTVEEAGDEALLMAEKTRGIPVIKGTDRYEAGLFAVQEVEPFVTGLKSGFLFILDDGFQHWRLYRDLDVLLIDSTNPFGNCRLIPSGKLREPLGEMKRADVIVLTRTGKSKGPDLMKDELVREIRKYNLDAPLYSSRHRPSGFSTMAGTELSSSILDGKAVFAFCGIGNPASFQDTLAGTGAEVTGFAAFEDHHAYSSRDIRGIFAAAKRCGADWIVTTEKDIMRLRGLGTDERIVSLRIEFEVEKGFYDFLFTEAR